MSGVIADETNLVEQHEALRSLLLKALGPNLKTDAWTAERRSLFTSLRNFAKQFPTQAERAIYLQSESDTHKQVLIDRDHERLRSILSRRVSHALDWPEELREQVEYVKLFESKEHFSRKCPSPEAREDLISYWQQRVSEEDAKTQLEDQALEPWLHVIAKLTRDDGKQR